MTAVDSGLILLATIVWFSVIYGLARLFVWFIGRFRP